MANKQPLEIARNIITQLDERIKMRKGIIKMIESKPEGFYEHHTEETLEELLQDHNDFLKELESLREFVIYKA